MSRELSGRKPHGRESIDPPEKGTEPAPSSLGSAPAFWAAGTAWNPDMSSRVDRIPSRASPWTSSWYLARIVVVRALAGESGRDSPSRAGWCWYLWREEEGRVGERKKTRRREYMLGHGVGWLRQRAGG